MAALLQQPVPRQSSPATEHCRLFLLVDAGVVDGKSVVDAGPVVEGVSVVGESVDEIALVVVGESVVSVVVEVVVVKGVLWWSWLGSKGHIEEGLRMRGDDRVAAWGQTVGVHTAILRRWRR